MIPLVYYDRRQVPGVYLCWELLVGNSNCRWYSMPKIEARVSRLYLLAGAVIWLLPATVVAAADPSIH